ncbi:MAG: leukotoxin LktA family filamentous adhesin, partial [Clostridiaceae bacterium]|nr:leukotoxin LktA family filamentous adhesin [Clostridiaceae bacterium]
MEEKKKMRMNKSKAVIAALAVLFLGQQVVKASNITDASGNAIQTGSNGEYNITPDAIDGNGTGYRKFQDMNLSQGDIMNFIFQYLQTTYGPGATGAIANRSTTDINKFVNLVKNQININGIINALDSVGGALKPGSQLVFISPNGMVVGSSGVLNVGSLSVVTPSTSDFNKYYGSSDIPNVSDYTSPNTTRILNTNGSYTEIGEATDNTTGYYSHAVTIGDSNFIPITIGDKGTVTMNGTAFNTNPDATVDVQGGVISRGDVNIQAGTLNVGAKGAILSGVKDSTVLQNPETYTDDQGVVHNQQMVYNGTTYATGADAAGALFNAIVNTDNMNTGNAFANTNGNIFITTATGTNVAEGGAVKNFGAAGDITIANGGANGINIAGKVYNPNGSLSVVNTNGALNVASTGDVQNVGTMTFNNSGSGMKLNGNVLNTGDLTAINSGADGMEIGGTVTNNTGAATFTNKAGQLNVKTGGVVTSNGTSLTMTNEETGTGFNVSGKVHNTNGTAKLENRAGDLSIDGIVLGDGSSSSMTIKNSGAGQLLVAQAGTVDNVNDLLMDNSGTNGLNINGTVKNTGNTTIKNTGA